MGDRHGERRDGAGAGERDRLRRGDLGFWTSGSGGARRSVVRIGGCCHGGEGGIGGLGVGPSISTSPPAVMVLPRVSGPTISGASGASASSITWLPACVCEFCGVAGITTTLGGCCGTAGGEVAGVSGGAEGGDGAGVGASAKRGDAAGGGDNASRGDGGGGGESAKCGDGAGAGGGDSATRGDSAGGGDTASRVGLIELDLLGPAGAGEVKVDALGTVGARDARVVELDALK